jgi:hypothetical protein
MAGKLISLPLRVSLCSAQIVTRAVSGVAGRALAIPGRAIQVVSSGRSNHVERDADRAEPDVAPRPASPTETPPAPRTVRAEPAPAPSARSEPPTHVSEEPVLVSESAEPGAEEGAGASVTVLEPWTGYGRMTARDVIDRVRSASVAELAALRLYEARHRGRRTVLAAADRQLKLAAGGHPA